MPIFEYRCEACENAFERLVRPTDAEVTCPACGSARAERLLSLPAVRSEQTRARAVRDIRARNRSIRSEQDRAEAKRIEAHTEDHDGK